MKDRHLRQSFLGESSEQIIANAKIGIIGLCGGGSHIAQQAAHVGFQNILACDFDHVEDHNLTRMIGSTPQDAVQAEKKTVVIERLVKAILPKSLIKVIDQPWQERELDFRDCDVIFGCVDSLAVRADIERFCRRYLIPYIDVGMDVYEVTDGFAIAGQVITSLPHGPCMKCLGYLTDECLAAEQERYGAAGGRPQVVWPNGVLASIAIGQLMALLTPWNARVKPQFMVEYDGNAPLAEPSRRLEFITGTPCPHFDTAGAVGDPFFKVRLTQPVPKLDKA